MFNVCSSEDISRQDQWTWFHLFKDFKECMLDFQVEMAFHDLHDSIFEQT